MMVNCIFLNLLFPAAGIWGDRVIQKLTNAARLFFSSCSVKLVILVTKILSKQTNAYAFMLQHKVLLADIEGISALQTKHTNQ